MIAKPERHRCPAHLRWVAQQSCLACHGMWPVPREARMVAATVTQAHHLTIAQPKARGLRAGDQWAVPLCVPHHDPNSRWSVHAAGDERAWWRSRGIDPLDVAFRLWRASIKAGRARNIISKGELAA